MAEDFGLSYRAVIRSDPSPVDAPFPLEQSGVEAWTMYPQADGLAVAFTNDANEGFTLSRERATALAKQLGAWLLKTADQSKPD